MLIYPLLEVVLIFCDYIKAVIDIIKQESVKGFEEKVFILECIFLGTWIQGAGECQQPEDLIRAELRFLASGLPVPEFIQF